MYPIAYLQAHKLSNMIRFENVTEKTFQTVYEKMEAAFPYEERRDFLDQKECLEKKYFNFFEIFDGESPVGFISPWFFEDFVYIEHLAIDSDKRNGGYGSKTIEKIKEFYKKPIILEAEAPETEQQIKRIKFYERLGFKVNSYPYTQPSYHGGDGVPLKILSYPDYLSQKDFENFVLVTKINVYNA